MTTPEPAFLDVAGRRIAYRLRQGGEPTLLFLPGYASDMEGSKALALDAFAQGRGVGILRFDYSGTGLSSGKFKDGTLALWLEEALAVVDQLTVGPLVL
ncbi:MAG TPA: alpha/beta hydrolase, partial [Sphingomicrobium sp.]|nr:alpha/beta hydrolase [Sphingomicrobium sp.]